MDDTRRTTGFTALALGLSVLLGTAPALAAPDDAFTVDTQFYGGPSSVVTASGAFSGCTLARDRFGTAADDGRVVRFLGVKRLTCGSEATVLLEYDVVFDPDTGATAGTWDVSASTLDGVEAGAGGGLIGDPDACTVKSFADGCLLETFSFAD